jgi:protein-S-isoprenylcysteine O-methyltransferase Ste14
MNLMFTIVYIVWFASEVLLNRFLHSKSGDKKNQDKGSVIIIWAMIVLGITGGIMISLNVKAPISSLQFLPYTGLTLIVAGMIFRFISIWSLGRYFTVDVTIREGHKIKKDGFYRVIRHPSYLGSLVSFAGLGISMNNWLSLAIIVVLVSFAFIYRIKIEEKVLIAQFGHEYLEYRKDTWNLIPWIY